MKRLLIGAVCAGLSMAGLAAEAAPKAPKPIPMTYFLHGIGPIDELESNIATGAYLTMDAVAPTGSQSKSKQVTNYVGGPNTTCAGNSMFPTFIGLLGGEVSGDVKVAFSSLAPPGSSINVQLFADVEAQACNDEFPKIAGAATVAVPAGQGKTEVVIKGVKLKAKSSFMLHFAPVDMPGLPVGLVTPTSQARIYYDSTADPSSISFSCVPKAGKKTC